MSDRYRIPDSDNRGEHARPTRPILVLITVLIQSVIATRVSRDDKLPDKLPRFLFSPLSSSSLFFLSSSSNVSPFSPSAREGTLFGGDTLSPVLHESPPLKPRSREVIIPKSILFETFSFFKGS